MTPFWTTIEHDDEADPFTTIVALDIELLVPKSAPPDHPPSPTETATEEEPDASAFAVPSGLVYDALTISSVVMSVVTAATEVTFGAVRAGVERDALAGVAHELLLSAPQPHGPPFDSNW